MTSARGRAGHIANRWESCGLHLQRKEGWWGNKASKSVGVQVCRISTALSGDKRAGEHLTLAEREETVRERFLCDAGSGLRVWCAKDCLTQPALQSILKSVQALGCLQSHAIPLLCQPHQEAFVRGISVPIFR